jgi:3-phosphoshikimate 1-carboxyvinyltransferase
MLKITSHQAIVSGDANPGGSKSVSNRMLILRALADVSMPIYNISQSNDTAILITLLKENPIEWNVQDAGTAARFSAAYLATRQGEEHVLTGTGRMLQRPMKPLLDALGHMGAEVTYLEKEGYLPVKIKGNKLSGGHFKLPHDVSSQFVTALALIAPFSANDMVIEFEESPLSAPYIQMTLNMLSDLYIHHEVTYDDKGGQKITIFNGTPAFPSEYWIEQDWSSASYWYAAVALSDSGEVRLDGYTDGSVQGDEVVASMFDALGVSTRFTEDGIVIKKTTKPESENFEFDFSDYPDLAPTFAVVLPLLGIHSHFSGLHTLAHKESDRVAVLAENLRSLGIQAEVGSNGSELEIFPAPKALNISAIIKTHNDHRMAMAFAPAVLKSGSLAIDNPDVVTKSYPTYWEELKKIYKFSELYF